MPLYLYEILDSNMNPTGKTVELFHSFTEKLDKHPETNENIRKCITAPFIGSKNSESNIKNITSDSNLARKGFTKYKRNKDGSYHRTVGNKGPSTIHPN